MEDASVERVGGDVLQGVVEDDVVQGGASCEGSGAYGRGPVRELEDLEGAPAEGVVADGLDGPGNAHVAEVGDRSTGVVGLESDTSVLERSRDDLDDGLGYYEPLLRSGELHQHAGALVVEDACYGRVALVALGNEYLGKVGAVERSLPDGGDGAPDRYGGDGRAVGERSLSDGDGYERRVVAVDDVGNSEGDRRSLAADGGHRGGVEHCVPDVIVDEGQECRRELGHYGHLVGDGPRGHVPSNECIGVLLAAVCDESLRGLVSDGQDVPGEAHGGPVGRDDAS